jgi:hypothetical protein
MPGAATAGVQVLRTRRPPAQQEFKRKSDAERWFTQQQSLIVQGGMPVASTARPGTLIRPK